jgi:hypothetical protein
MLTLHALLLPRCLTPVMRARCWLLRLQRDSKVRCRLLLLLLMLPALLPPR